MWVEKISKIKTSQTDWDRVRERCDSHQANQTKNYYGIVSIEQESSTIGPIVNQLVKWCDTVNRSASQLIKNNNSKYQFDVIFKCCSSFDSFNFVWILFI